MRRGGGARALYARSRRGRAPARGAARIEATPREVGATRAWSWDARRLKAWSARAMQEGVCGMGSAQTESERCARGLECARHALWELGVRTMCAKMEGDSEMLHARSGGVFVRGRRSELYAALCARDLNLEVAYPRAREGESARTVRRARTVEARVREVVAHSGECAHGRSSVRVGWRGVRHCRVHGVP